MSCSGSSSHRCPGESRIFKQSVNAILQKQKAQGNPVAKPKYTSEDITNTQSTASKPDIVNCMRHDNAVPNVKHVCTKSRYNLKQSDYNDSSGVKKKTLQSKVPKKQRKFAVRKTVTFMTCTDKTSVVEKGCEALPEQSDGKRNAKDTLEINVQKCGKDANNNHFSLDLLPVAEASKSGVVAEQIFDAQKSFEKKGHVIKRPQIGYCRTDANNKFCLHGDASCQQDAQKSNSFVNENNTDIGGNVNFEQAKRRSVSKEAEFANSFNNNRSLKHLGMDTKYKHRDSNRNCFGHRSNKASDEKYKGSVSKHTTEKAYCRPIHRDSYNIQDSLLNKRMSQRLKHSNSDVAVRTDRHCSRTWYPSDAKPPRFGGNLQEDRLHAFDRRSKAQESKNSEPDAELIINYELPVSEDWSKEASDFSEPAETNMEHAPLYTSVNFVEKTNSDNCYGTGKTPYLPPPPPTMESEMMSHIFQHNVHDTEVFVPEEDAEHATDQNTQNVNECTGIMESIILNEDASSVNETLRSIEERSETVLMNDASGNIPSGVTRDSASAGTADSHSIKTPIPSNATEPKVEFSNSYSPQENATDKSNTSKDCPESDVVECDAHFISPINQNSSLMHSILTDFSSISEINDPPGQADKIGHGMKGNDSNHADVSDNACSDFSNMGYSSILFENRASTNQQNNGVYDYCGGMNAFPENDVNKPCSDMCPNPQKFDYLSLYHKELNSQWMRYLEWCAYWEGKWKDQGKTNISAENESVLSSNIMDDKYQNYQDAGIHEHLQDIKHKLHSKLNATADPDYRLSDYWTEKLPAWVNSQTNVSRCEKVHKCHPSKETTNISSSCLNKEKKEEVVQEKLCSDQAQTDTSTQRHGMEQLKEKINGDSRRMHQQREVHSKNTGYHCSCNPAQVQYLVWRVCTCDVGNPPRLHEILSEHQHLNIRKLDSNSHELSGTGACASQPILGESKSLPEQLLNNLVHAVPQRMVRHSSEDPQASEHTNPLGTHTRPPPGFLPLSEFDLSHQVLKETDKEKLHAVKPKTVTNIAGNSQCDCRGFENAPYLCSKEMESEIQHKPDSDRLEVSLEGSIDCSSPDIASLRAVSNINSSALAQSGLKAQYEDNIGKVSSSEKMPECLYKSVDHLRKAECELKKADLVHANLSSTMESINKTINVIQHTLQMNRNLLNVDSELAAEAVKAVIESSRKDANVDGVVTPPIFENAKTEVKRSTKGDEQECSSGSKEPKSFVKLSLQHDENGKFFQNEWEVKLTRELDDQKLDRLKYAFVSQLKQEKLCPESKEVRKKSEPSTDEYCAVSVDDCSYTTDMPIASQSPVSHQEDREVQGNTVCVSDIASNKKELEMKEPGEIEDEVEIYPHDFLTQSNFNGQSETRAGYNMIGTDEWRYPRPEYFLGGHTPPRRYRPRHQQNFYRHEFTPPPFPPPSPPGFYHQPADWIPSYFPPPAGFHTSTYWNRHPMNPWQHTPSLASLKEQSVEQSYEYPAPSREVNNACLFSEERKEWMTKGDMHGKEASADYGKLKLVDYETSDNEEVSRNIESDSQLCNSNYVDNSNCTRAVTSIAHTPKKQKVRDGIQQVSAQDIHGSEECDNSPGLERKLSKKLKQKTLKTFTAPDCPGAVSNCKTLQETIKDVSSKPAYVMKETANINTSDRISEEEFSHEFPKLSKDFSQHYLPTVRSPTSLPPLPPFPGSTFWGMYLPSSASPLLGNRPQNALYPTQQMEHQAVQGSRYPVHAKKYSHRSWPLTFQQNTALSSSDSEILPTSNWKSSFKQFHNFGVKYIDTHCHLDFLFSREGFRGNLKEYMDKHEETFPDMFAGCVAVFCNPATFTPYGGLWQEVAKEDNVWIAMGCHPKMAQDFTTAAEQGLMKCLAHHKCVALGEIGLDYSKTFQQHEGVQKQVFRKQLKIAMMLQKPLVIHCRDAEQDCLEILKEMVPRDYKIHCHCFTGYYSNAQLWLDAFPNLYIGVTPLVTYRTAVPSHDLARNIPLNRLLLETDAPYFIPRCIPKEELQYSTPGLAITVAKEIAKYQELPVAAVLRQCRLNTKFMYGI